MNALEDELERRGLVVTAGDDDIEGDPRTPRAKKIALTPELVAKAVTSAKITDLAHALNGKLLVSPRAISADLPITKAYDVSVKVLDQADKNWRKKHTLVYHDDQLVIIERPEERVAAELYHMALEHEKPAEKPKTAEKPKRAAKPKAEAPAGEKPKRATRKPKAGE